MNTQKKRVSIFKNYNIKEGSIYHLYSFNDLVSRRVAINIGLFLLHIYFLKSYLHSVRKRGSVTKTERNNEYPWPHTIIKSGKGLMLKSTLSKYKECSGMISKTMK